MLLCTKLILKSAYHYHCGLISWNGLGKSRTKAQVRRPVLTRMRKCSLGDHVPSTPL